jgi:hypothetical protein
MLKTPDLEFFVFINPVIPASPKEEDENLTHPTPSPAPAGLSLFLNKKDDILVSKSA